LPLGVAENSEYEELFLEFKPGQILCIGTDGIWETRNSQDELFGKERFESAIRSYAAEPAETIMQFILKDVEEFRGALDQEDDVTLVIVKAKEA